MKRVIRGELAAFVRRALVVGAVLAPPLPLLLDTPDPGLAVAASRPIEFMDQAPMYGEPTNGQIAPPLPLLGPDEAYRKHCAPCHGEAGRGDGIVARAFNPPPANFTDRALMAERTDDQLWNSVKNGKEAMPAFGSILKTAELEGLVSFIRGFIPDEERVGS